MVSTYDETHGATGATGATSSTGSTGSTGATGAAKPKSDDILDQLEAAGAALKAGGLTLFQLLEHVARTGFGVSISVAPKPDDKKPI